jgi:hypothetical protein
MFCLTQFGIRNPCSRLLCWRLAESDNIVIPPVMCMDWLRHWYNNVAQLHSSSTAPVFVTKMSQKHKSTSPCEIQVKKLVKDNQYWREIRLYKPTWKKVTKLLTFRKLDSLIVVYIQLVNMLTELQKVLWDWTVPKTMGVSFLHFYCIRNK